ncbi:TPA: hypothetical protein BOS_8165 [Bos taurus]|nr:TPA: hypothetical protein BOS_8165 [Bos taurus]
MASGSLLRRATCQCLSNRASGPLQTVNNRLARPGPYPPSLCGREGRGRQVWWPSRKAAGKSKTLTPTVKFSKNPRVTPQAASVGNGPQRVPAHYHPRRPAPPRPRGKPRAGGGVWVARKLCTRGAPRPARTGERARPAAAENGSGCRRMAVIG